ncbi:MAG: transcription antitermination factor NusB [Aeromicrobium sp.]|uniref:transcription antitermination factor NusB n=1 Tax=Aeromicrobium sp. TaxID=1871063 RepID=UPI003C63881F
MSARTKSRKRALDVLFESELQDLPLGGSLAERRSAHHEYPANDYAAALVEGVVAHHERLDELIAEHAVGWTMERMPGVDRNLLRIGAYEILYRDDVPDAVAVSEAVDLAGEFSTDESPKFVAGLLGRLVELKPSLAT